MYRYDLSINSSGGIEGMYEAVWQISGDEITGERALAYVQRIWQHARWNSFDRM
jgi:hypothetical protein